MRVFQMMAVAAGLMLLASPAGAVGQGKPTAQTFSTSLVAIDPAGAGEFDGTLQLRITPDGIVQGYYRPADSGSFRDVTGGLAGNQIWLDIGEGRVLHVEGTYENGTIVGYTFVDGPRFGVPNVAREYKFEATPEITGQS